MKRKKCGCKLHDVVKLWHQEKDLALLIDPASWKLPKKSWSALAEKKKEFELCRNQALEEAAKIADAYSQPSDYRYVHVIASEISKAIRSQKGR